MIPTSRLTRASFASPAGARGTGRPASRLIEDRLIRDADLSTVPDEDRRHRRKGAEDEA